MKELFSSLRILGRMIYIMVSIPAICYVGIQLFNQVSLPADTKLHLGYVVIALLGLPCIDVLGSIIHSFKATADRETKEGLLANFYEYRDLAKKCQEEIITLRNDLNEARLKLKSSEQLIAMMKTQCEQTEKDKKNAEERAEKLSVRLTDLATNVTQRMMIISETVKTEGISKEQIDDTIEKNMEEMLKVVAENGQKEVEKGLKDFADVLTGDKPNKMEVIAKAKKTLNTAIKKVFEEMEKGAEINPNQTNAIPVEQHEIEEAGEWETLNQSNETKLQPTNSNALTKPSPETQT